jgi:hypothetical protein
MYKVWLIIWLKVYLKSLCAIVQVLGFRVSVILGPKMASAYDFTRINLLYSKTESKYFPPEPWNWSVPAEVYTIKVQLFS